MPSLFFTMSESRWLCFFQIVSCCPMPLAHVQSLVSKQDGHKCCWIVFMSPLRNPLISRTLSTDAFALPEIYTYIEQNVNVDSRILGKVVRKSYKMKGVFDVGTFRSGLIYALIQVRNNGHCLLIYLVSSPYIYRWLGY